MSRRCASLPLWLLLVGGCATVPAEPDIEAELRRRVMQDYIAPFKAGDVARWMDVFADDAVGMHDTLPPFVGREAIRGFGEMVRDHLVVDTLEVTVEEVRRNGDWAYTRGSYLTRFLPRSGAPGTHTPRPRKGKFLLLWERQPDGAWKVVVDMGNGSEQPGAAP